MPRRRWPSAWAAAGAGWRRPWRPSSPASPHPRPPRRSLLRRGQRRWCGSLTAGADPAPWWPDGQRASCPTATNPSARWRGSAARTVPRRILGADGHLQRHPRRRRVSGGVGDLSGSPPLPPVSLTPPPPPAPLHSCLAGSAAQRSVSGPMARSGVAGSRAGATSPSTLPFPVRPGQSGAARHPQLNACMVAAAILCLRSGPSIRLRCSGAASGLRRRLEEG